MYITINKNYYPQTIKMRQSNGWTTIKVSNFKAKISVTPHSVSIQKIFLTLK